MTYKADISITDGLRNFKKNEMVEITHGEKMETCMITSIDFDMVTVLSARGEFGIPISRIRNIRYISEDDYENDKRFKRAINMGYNNRDATYMFKCPYCRDIFNEYGLEKVDGEKHCYKCKSCNKQLLIIY